MGTPRPSGAATPGSPASSPGTAGPSGEPGANPGGGPPGSPVGGGATGGALQGPAAGRRLTREEYLHSIGDLLKIDLGADRGGLPGETPSGGFRNNVDGLVPSQVRTTAYETLATRISAAVKWTGGLAAFAACADGTPACELGFVRRLGRALYRRALAEVESQNLARLFAVTRGEPAAFEAGARLVLEAMLQSPHFLYRPERIDRPSPSGPELATRLSYLLWKSAPDEDLLTAAEQGRLGNDTGTREIVTGMMRDARARRGLREYVEDWLQLYRLDDRAPDAAKGVTAELLGEIKEETLALASRLAIDEPADLMRLFTEERTDLGPSLARLYGLTPTGPGPRRYDLSTNPHRIGILTQPAVLSVHAAADHASIVDRGLVVMRMFLCGETPQPPDGVTTQLKNIAANLTDRERFALHNADPSCATCHKMFDPLGQPFEPYDVVGRHRAKDAHGNVLRDDGAVDLDGGKHTFPNVAAFAALLGKSATVERCLVRKLFQYAYGRPLGAGDAAPLAQLEKRFSEAGRTYRALIDGLTASPGFRATAPVR